MSEFSKEYYEISGVQIGIDFSYMDIFKKLKPNQAMAMICEGLGTIGIKNIDGIPFLVKSNGEEVNLNKLLTEKKD